MHTTGSELQRVGLKGIIPHLALNGAIIGLADRGSTLFGPEEFLLARGGGISDGRHIYGRQLRHRPARCHHTTDKVEQERVSLCMKNFLLYLPRDP